MVFSLRESESPGLVNEVFSQVAQGYMLENALFGIDSLLANAELGERSASAHNDIGIPAPFVYFALVAVHLRAVGNVDLDDLAVTDLDMLEFHGDGHVEGVGVVDDIEDVSRDGKHLGWIDARERAVVLYAEQDSAAERVGERADGFEEILFRLVAATLEFDAVVLALFDNVSQLMRVHGDHPFGIVPWRDYGAIGAIMARLWRDWRDYGAIGAIMARFLEHAGADATAADLPAVEERAFWS
mgnify:FL=1